MELIEKLGLYRVTHVSEDTDNAHDLLQWRPSKNFVSALLFFIFQKLIVSH